MFLDGVRQVRRDPRLTALLLTSGLLFGLAWEFEIVVPLMARYAFHGGAGILGMLTSGQAVGAVVGGLWAARRSGRAPTTPGRPAMAFGVAMLAAAVAPTLAFELVALLACGVTGIALVVSISTRIQLMAPPAIRGRVLALFTVCTVGVRPVCAPLVGWVGQHFGPRWALGLGAGVVLLVIVPSWRYISKTIRRSELDAAVVVPVPEATMTSL
jgi:predicted MFS family arabinose efflux permease